VAFEYQNMCNEGDSVTCSGSPFQTRAVETGKARSPTAQRRVGGTTSASDDYERSRCLDSRSAASCRSSARHVRTTIDEHGQLVLDALRYKKPMHVPEQRCDMLVFPCQKHETGGSIRIN